MNLEIKDYVQLRNGEICRVLDKSESAVMLGDNKVIKETFDTLFLLEVDSDYKLYRDEDSEWDIVRKMDEELYPEYFI